jgi:putative transposase
MAWEALPVRTLVKNRRLAKAISDASWARFRHWVEYFGRVHGIPVLAVPPQYTIQRCSGCGMLVYPSLLVRTPVCPHGGLLLDRDHNAAVVIREAGLEQATRQGIWDPLRHESVDGVLPPRLDSGTVGHTGT